MITRFRKGKHAILYMDDRRVIKVWHDGPKEGKMTEKEYEENLKELGLLTKDEETKKK